MRNPDGFRSAGARWVLVMVVALVFVMMGGIQALARVDEFGGRVGSAYAPYTEETPPAQIGHLLLR